jgi:hypothetical protein
MGHTVLLLYHGAGRGGQWGRRLHGMTSLFTHHEEVQVASGFGYSRAHERERKKQGEEKKISLPLLYVQGKKKKKQCRLKMTPFRFPLFLSEECMKRRRFSQNTPFHLNGN